MKVGEKLQFLKFFSSIFNTVFLILGFSIFGCALWILFDTESFIAVLSSGEVKNFAGGLFIIGLVAVGVSVLGCVGAYLENRCLFIAYMIFLICIVLGQIFITALLLLRQGKIDDKLTNAVDDIINGYGSVSSELKWNLIDNVQHYGQCCGRQRPADWGKNIFIMSVNMSSANQTVFPCSCFNSSNCPLLSSNSTRFGTGTNFYTEGCQDKILSWLRENILGILGMDVSLLLIQVLQFVVSVYLFQYVGVKSRQKHFSHLISSEEIPETSNNYPEPNIVYPEPNTVYLEPNTVYPEANTVYPEPNTVYPEANTVYPEANTVYPEANTVYPEPNTVYPKPNTVYPEPNTSYLETNTSYPETNTSYLNPNLRYAYSDQHHVQPTQNYF